MTTNPLTVRDLIAALSKLPPNTPIAGWTINIPETAEEKADKWFKQFSYDLDRAMKPLDFGAPHVLPSIDKLSVGWKQSSEIFRDGGKSYLSTYTEQSLHTLNPGDTVTITADPDGSVDYIVQDDKTLRRKDA